MKKIITLKIIVLSVMLVKAQNITLQTFIDRYNTILNNEKSYFMKEFYPLTICEPDEECDSIKKNHFSSKFALERIKYLEFYLLDTIPNKRMIVVAMICSIGANSNNIVVRQRAVNDILNSLYSAIQINTIDGYFMFFNINDYNEKAKERIKEILRGVKKQFEIDFMRDYSFKEFMTSNNYIDKEAHYIAKRDNISFESVRDSLIIIEKKKIYSNNYDYDLGGLHNIRYLPGLLYMYDFVPEMEQMLKDSNFYEYNYNYIKLNIARMGNKEYEKEYLYYDYFNKKVLFFINTQTSAEFYIKNYINNDTLRSFFADGGWYEPFSWGAYYDIQNWILNLPNKYKISTAYSLSDEEKEKLNKGRKWLNKNIGKFELNPDVNIETFSFE